MFKLYSNFPMFLIIVLYSFFQRFLYSVFPIFKYIDFAQKKRVTLYKKTYKKRFSVFYLKKKTKKRFKHPISRTAPLVPNVCSRIDGPSNQLQLALCGRNNIADPQRICCGQPPAAPSQLRGHGRDAGGRRARLGFGFAPPFVGALVVLVVGVGLLERDWALHPPGVRRVKGPGGSK